MPHFTPAVSPDGAISPARRRRALPSLVVLRLALWLLGQDAIQRALRIGEHLASLCDLIGLPGARDLPERRSDVTDLSHQVEQLLIGLVGRPVPGGLSL